MLWSQGAQEALFTKGLFGELGFDVAVEIASDAKAALASAERAGLGHMKHMELRLMFLKDLVKNKVLRLVRLRSAENPADVLTKPVSGEAMQRALRAVGAWPEDFGRGAAPKLVQMVRAPTRALSEQCRDAVWRLTVRVHELEVAIQQLEVEVRRLRWLQSRLARVRQELLQHGIELEQLMVPGDFEVVVRNTFFDCVPRSGDSDAGGSAASAPA